MKMCRGLAAIPFIVCAAPCFAEHKDPQAMMIGGTESCASWLNALQNPSLAGYRKNWIYGFFSGANLFDQDGMVGHTTDAEGGVGEVAKLCRDEPSLALNSATARVYVRMQNQSR